MAYTVSGFSQQKILEYGLTLDEVVMLQCIFEMFNSPSHTKLHCEDGVYIWFDFVTLKHELPILKMTEQSFSESMHKLGELDLIDIQHIEIEHGDELVLTFKILGVSVDALQED